MVSVSQKSRNGLVGYSAHSLKVAGKVLAGLHPHLEVRLGKHAHPAHEDVGSIQSLSLQDLWQLASSESTKGESRVNKGREQDGWEGQQQSLPGQAVRDNWCVPRGLLPE